MGKLNKDSAFYNRLNNLKANSLLDSETQYSKSRYKLHRISTESCGKKDPLRKPSVPDWIKK